jgi:hypothetical protein
MPSVFMLNVTIKYIMLSVIVLNVTIKSTMLSVILLSVAFSYCYTECHFAEGHYA